MPETNGSANAKEEVRDKPEPTQRKGSTRRAFLSQVSGAAATIAAGAVIAGAPPAQGASQSQESAAAEFGDGGRTRALQAYANRIRAAQADLNTRTPNEITNGDEQRFSNRIGNYSKGLAHNGVGEVLPSSYASFLRAVNSGQAALFDQIQMGGNTPLVDPQAGLAFDLEGMDSHQLAIGTPPSVASREMADTAIENYWMALCRDVNFTQYGNEPLTQAAIAELNSLPAFHGPKPVTPQTLFRGFTAGDILGPYVSQFLLMPFDYGAVTDNAIADDVRSERRLHDGPGIVACGAERAGAVWSESDRSESTAHAQRAWDRRVRSRGRFVRGVFQRVSGACRSECAARS